MRIDRDDLDIQLKFDVDRCLFLELLRSLQAVLLWFLLRVKLCNVIVENQLEFEGFESSEMKAISQNCLYIQTQRHTNNYQYFSAFIQSITIRFTFLLLYHDLLSVYDKTYFHISQCIQCENKQNKVIEYEQTTFKFREFYYVQM